MFEKDSIGRSVLLLLIGAAITTIFWILIAYPTLLANSRENAVRIEVNEERIQLLWEAHYIRHDPPTRDGG